MNLKSQALKEEVRDLNQVLSRPMLRLGIVQSRRVIAIAIVALRVRLVLLGKGFLARTKAQMHYFELFRVLL